MWDHINKFYNASVPRDFEHALELVSGGNFIFIAMYEHVVKAVTKSCDNDVVSARYSKFNSAVDTVKVSTLTH